MSRDETRSNVRTGGRRIGRGCDDGNGEQSGDEVAGQRRRASGALIFLAGVLGVSAGLVPLFFTLLVIGTEGPEAFTDVSVSHRTGLVLSVAVWLLGGLAAMTLGWRASGRPSRPGLGVLCVMSAAVGAGVWTLLYRQI